MPRLRELIDQLDDLPAELTGDLSGGYPAQRDRAANRPAPLRGGAITDPFLRFGFRFVAPRESRLHTREQAERYMEQAIVPQLDKFVSEDAFERVCQGWLLGELEDAVDAGRCGRARLMRPLFDRRARLTSRYN